MSQDTRPAALDDSGSAAALADFRISSPPEIMRWLQQLRESSVPVILNGPDGQSYCTTLWTTDTANQRMTFSADEQHLQLQQLVDNDEVVAVAYLDNVKLQFDVRQPVLVRGAQGCALQAQLPREMFRFQRRSSFRVRTAERSGPVAQLRHPSMPEMMLKLRIMDVSIGGCSLRMPDDTPPLQPGTRVQRVLVELDTDTRFHSGLLLHHIGSSPGGHGVRLGCEWVDMEAAAQRLLQRFIDGAQKRRRLLTLP
ncbi:MAG: flagellar brake protein [Rubrivivax sp.]